MMTDTDVRQMALQTASEDYATRAGAPYDLAYVRKLAQQWALRRMLDIGADVATAKQWETDFMAGYTETYAALSQRRGPQEESEGQR